VGAHLTELLPVPAEGRMVARHDRYRRIH
jgi:hypothetical protein